MKFKSGLLVFFFFVFSFSIAQSKKITAKNGVWSFSQFTDNIIKVNFQPTGYKTNENISDAVIAKPSPKKNIPAIIENDVVYLGKNKKVKITGMLTGNEYKGFDISLEDGEKIFGGGERALPLNRRGYKFNLYNNPWYGYGEGADNLNYSVPFFTSSMGYGLFFDNPSKGYADIGKPITKFLKQVL